MIDPVEVSFIMPTYCRAEVLRHCLEKLYAHEYGFPFEVLVLDNGSEDGTVSMVEREFPQVRLFAMAENLGAVARNKGIAESRGRYIVALDDDSYPQPGAVEKAVAVFRKDLRETIGCIALTIHRENGELETAGIYRAFTGCGAVFRRSLFDRIGGYPDDYLFYVEEYDLSCRIYGQGLETLNFRELGAVHLKTGVNRDFNAIMARLVRNNLMLWAKYLPRPLAARQIETELWRYHKIALKEDALAGFEEGKRAGDIFVARYQRERRHALSAQAAGEILDLRNIHARVRALKAQCPGGPVLIYKFGKLMSFVLEALVAQGVPVLGIVDANRFMQKETFQGVPIYSRERLEKKDYAAVLLGSSALSWNDTAEKELRALCPGVPVFRLCDYDRLADYL